LDLDALADVLADDLADDAPHPAHVDGCPACSAQLAELRVAQELVRGELAALPAPDLPADLAERLDAALAGAEARADSVTALPVRTHQRGPARWLPAAAAVVLVLGGVSFGVAQLRDDNGDSRNTNTAAKDSTSLPKSELAVVRNDSGTNYTDRASLLAGTAQRTVADSALSAPAPGAAGGTSESGATPRNAAPFEAAVADPLARLRDTTGLADCLLALLPPDDQSVQPLALDYGSYKGTPALVVVLPSPQPKKLDVYVVGAGCSRADDSLLFYASVDKP
jgi:hypothetical protein